MALLQWRSRVLCLPVLLLLLVVVLLLLGVRGNVVLGSVLPALLLVLLRRVRVLLKRCVWWHLPLLQVLRLLLGVRMMVTMVMVRRRMHGVVGRLVLAMAIVFRTFAACGTGLHTQYHSHIATRTQGPRARGFIAEIHKNMRHAYITMLSLRVVFDVSCHFQAVLVSSRARSSGSFSTAFNAKNVP